MHLCECMLTSVVLIEARGGQCIPLTLQLQMVVSHLVQVLGTKLKSYGRAAGIVNSRVVSPSPL